MPGDDAAYLECHGSAPFRKKKFTTEDTEIFVIPAKAGIQGQRAQWSPWTPAFAGVTMR